MLNQVKLTGNNKVYEHKCIYKTYEILIQDLET